MLKKISIHISIMLILAVPLFALAQVIGSNPSTGSTIPNPTTAGDDIMSVLIALLTNVVMPIAAIVVVMWIIWAGFSYVTAQGNPTKVAQAHQRLLWSLIGAGILLSAAGIAKVVQTTITSLLKP